MLDVTQEQVLEKLQTIKPSLSIDDVGYFLGKIGLPTIYLRSLQAEVVCWRTFLVHARREMPLYISSAPVEVE